jgi:membrane fusion protein (multidrug efflux system)
MTLRRSALVLGRSPTARRRSALALHLLPLPLAAACGESAPPAPPPVEVVVAPVVQRDVPVTSEWIGTTEGTVDAEIRAQVSGYLLSRDYQEGRLVRASELLFRIDPRPFQAALDQARGDLGRAQAALEKARLDVERYTPLVREGAVSQQELDNATQARRAGEASVQAARAAVEKAQLDLSFTEIRSPIDGVAGVAVAQVGNLVGPSDPKPLTTVSQVDPIRVSAPVSERDYLAFARRVGDLAEGGEPRDATLELILADGSVYPHRGRAIFAGREVDPRTGTILFKAEFPNPGNLLRPGQYARVRAVTEVKKGALLVPQRAVAELQGVPQVAVVGPDDKVSMRVVQTGVRDGPLQVIEKGLEPGERVVVEGLQKVREGSAVTPKPASEG